MSDQHQNKKRKYIKKLVNDVAETTLVPTPVITPVVIVSDFVVTEIAVPEITPEITPEIVPEIAVPEITSEKMPEIAVPEITPEKMPEIADSELVPEITQEIAVPEIAVPEITPVEIAPETVVLEISKDKPCYIVVDTETTGFSRGKPLNPKIYSQFDTCRVVELAFCIFEFDTHKLLFQDNFYINTDGKMSAGAQSVHNISPEMLKEKGLTIFDAFSKFHNALITYKPTTFVAHNIAFDLNVIKAECYRAITFRNLLVNIFREILEYIEKMNHECTQKISCQFKNLGLKHNPSLQVLCASLGIEYKNGHQALADTLMCAKCFETMKKMS